MTVYTSRGRPRPKMRFSGTERNTTSQTVRDVRVEIHLSNGVEPGPTPRVGLSAGETRPVELDGRGQTFDGWTVHMKAGVRCELATKRTLGRGAMGAAPGTRCVSFASVRQMSAGPRAAIGVRQ